ncbi:MAG: aminopeptidase P family protein [Muribaculaceae bacterium]|nr:aminopeptidase P family protein [Muribaculaceae bacterium]
MNTSIKTRIDSLRAEMKNSGISATIIPQTDPHQSEYISDHWQVRRWLSGFTGSAGTLVITLSEALLWTDSRYFIQAAQQLSGTDIILMKDGLPDTPSIVQYLIDHLSNEEIVGIDSMVFSTTETTSMRNTLSTAGISLIDTFSPIDKIWVDRPQLPDGEIFEHEEEYAGEKTASKIKRVLENAKKQGADSTFISALDEIAWTLNIRGNDVAFNPVATSFLFLAAKNSTLFIDNKKINEKTLEYLNNNSIQIAPYNSVISFLQALPSTQKVLINPTGTADRFASVLGSRAIKGQSAVAIPKACKNETQLAGIRKAMERDGAALVKLYMEIERRMTKGETLTEIEVGELAAKFRAQGELYFDDSFNPIAGYGAHGAIVHYSATDESNATLQPDNLFLFDSGAQYLDGTTDITRTISLGNPTKEQRHDFTLVMKGHIALGTAIFPAGTRGAQLDALARQFLWKEGLSYLHGTGHGIGHFLNVHEGPQSIRLNENPTPLTVGMITSNEPGLYRESKYGIRCENLVLTIPAFSTEFGEFLKFETLTLFPFDLSLFETEIMTDEEITWLNNYHQEVYNRISPRLNDAEKAWLKAKTAPLTR